MDGAAYQTESEIADVVQKFENCSYRLGEFSHVRHLTVASWYIVTYGAEEALRRMREGLRRFLDHHGKTMGYHETITRFWLELLGEALRQAPTGSLPERINEITVRFSDKNVLFRYYTREVVMSEEARERWVEPDLRCLSVSA